MAMGHGFGDSWSAGRASHGHGGAGRTSFVGSGRAYGGGGYGGYPTGVVGTRHIASAAVRPVAAASKVTATATAGKTHRKRDKEATAGTESAAGKPAKKTNRSFKMRKEQKKEEKKEQKKEKKKKKEKTERKEKKRRKHNANQR